MDGGLEGGALKKYSLNDEFKKKNTKDVKGLK